MKQKIRIAIQKQGRLTKESLSFFLNLIWADVPLRDRVAQQMEAGDLSIGLTPEIELLLVRNKDIPILLASGAVDLGITGRNTLIESNLQPDLLDTLGFGNCRLSIAVPQKSEIYLESDLSGLKIATSFPFSVRTYLESKKIQPQIVALNGSVELAPALGIADVIADLVCSGVTLKNNALRECFCIYESEACLLGSLEAYQTLESLGLVQCQQEPQRRLAQLGIAI